MKTRFVKVLCTLLALLCITMPLAACGGMPLTIAKDGESKYQIVYPNGDRDAANAANRLAADLEELTGAELTVTDDRTEVDKKIPEILVGRTNRGVEYEEQRTLLKGEYVIAREGKTVYILGAGDGVLSVACDDFLESVLTEKLKVEGKGVLLRSEAPKYRVTGVTLNGKPITDYTVLLPEGTSTLNWKTYFSHVETTLSSLSGNLLTFSTYSDITSPAITPAILLNGSIDGLGATEYKIETKGDNIVISVGSDTMAMAVAVALMDQLAYHGEETVALDLKAGGGKAGESPLIPSSSETDLRIMCFNVYGNETHRNLMSYASASALAYGSDFICMQEFYEVAYDTIAKDLEKAGYAVVGTTFTEVSPTAIEKDDAKYTKLGKMCNTPIFYRADQWEAVESGAYLFYWRSRYHGSNTKSLTYGVFRNKSTGELISVMSTHFPLMAESYKTMDGINYSNFTDSKEGAQWRYEAALEVLKQVDALRAKYPGILTVVGGDMNAQSTEKAMKTFEAHDILSDAIVMAPADHRGGGSSFHEYGKAPTGSYTPIDHWFVSEDVANVVRHVIVSDPLTVQGSDHCPVVVDISKK